ncbi:MAG: hypothetical protein Kow0090_07670 [Myxococcota bacterium]
MNRELPTLSVIVPISTGAEEFLAQKEAFIAQRYPSKIEFIYIDSREDKAGRLAAMRSAKIIPLEKSEFRHGKARNDGVKLATGEVVAFLSEDALPLGKLYFYNLVSALLDYGFPFAGVSARHIPHSGKLLFSRYAVLTSPYNVPSGIKELPLNNVASILWRNILIENPFPDDALFGEDILFSQRVSEKGFKLGFAPRAVVLHSHQRSAKYTFLRYYADAYLWEGEGRRRNPAAEIENKKKVRFLPALATSKAPPLSLAEFLFKSTVAFFGAAYARHDRKKGVPPKSQGKV